MKQDIKPISIFFFFGIAVALLWNVTNLSILFLLPLTGLALLTKQKKLSLAAIMIGFLIIFVPINIISNQFIQKDSDFFSTVRGHASNIYDILLKDVTLDEEKKEEADINILFHKKMILDDFDNGALGYTIESGKEYNTSLHISSFGKNNRSLKISFDTPIVNDVTIRKTVSQKNWKDYLYVTFWINSQQDLGLFEIIIEDEDGDYWHYFDEKLLLKRGWQNVKVPLNDLENPSWTHRGDRRLELGNIRSFYLNFNSLSLQTRPYKYSFYIDEISLES